jgi:hypothetical protein
LPLFHVIPELIRATEGRRSEQSERAHPVSWNFQIPWTPVFTCLREAASAKAGRGDEYSAIFSRLRFAK